MDIITICLLSFIVILDLVFFIYATRRFVQCGKGEDKLIIEKKDILLYANYRCRKCGHIFTVVVPKDAVSKLKYNSLQVSGKMHNCKKKIEEHELVVADLISLSNHRLKCTKDILNLDKRRYKI